ncbi:hypothetical protein SAMN05421548_12811 [Paraburkholderia lycopersici]|uniref:Uncharacterized protein n=1 Tax=Paraburkholderia lycopersici TaxID=416944 RepID=A0A1G6YJN3_9BURK|nr:hypothetical protein SAMN05421548_12811 [Paraburkholderia lycopersici]
MRAADFKQVTRREISGAPLSGGEKSLVMPKKRILA